VEWYLTLVRHGSTDMNEENRFTGISDPPLNKKGIEQAKKSAEFLFDWALKNKIEFDLILTSPLKRCLDTANEFKRLFGLEYVKEILLTERNYGIFESLSHKEAAEKYPELFYEYQKDKPFITLPNGESGLE
jgi:broad specificity phosphatase PhoE